MSPERRSLDVMPLMRSSFPIIPIDDIAEGPGLHVEVGEGTAQIFPTSRVARAELAGNRARVTDLTRVEVENGSLNAYGETEQHHSALRLDPTSLVVVTSKKREQAEGAGQRVEPAAAPAIPPAVPLSPSTDVITHEPAGSALEAPASPEHANQPEPEQERVNLVGRIGHTPQYRTTPKGTLVASFSLAVHPEPGQTDWHRVVLFGERAEKLRVKGFGKGDEVQVVGYPHERERRNGKTGETTTITEIYAAVVKTPTEQEASSSPKQSSGEE